MNQTAIGSYIARKRKEQNLTQEQLAQQLGVSSKTISKGNRQMYASLQRHPDALRCAPRDAPGADGRRRCGRGQRPGLEVLFAISMIIS